MDCVFFSYLYCVSIVACWETSAQGTVHESSNGSTTARDTNTQQSGVMIHDHQLIIKCLYTLISDYTSKTRLSDQHDAWLRVKNILGQPYDLLLCQLMRDEAEKLNQIDSDTINELQNFSDQALMNTSDFKKFRTDFSAIIVRTNELLTTVGGYHLDVQQLAVNQLDLYFDAKIGEKS